MNLIATVLGVVFMLISIWGFLASTVLFVTEGPFFLVGMGGFILTGWIGFTLFRNY